MIRIIRNNSLRTLGGVGGKQYDTNQRTVRNVALTTSLMFGVGLYSMKRDKHVLHGKSLEVQVGVQVEQTRENKGFRKKQLMKYENKLRLHAQPDKVFRFFATVAAYFPDGRREDFYMTPDDFVRSLTPNGEPQPDDCLLDCFRRIKTSQKGSKMSPKELETIGKTFAAFGGYINYEDYIFLLTVLTTPKRNFEIAFRMFDLDGNGVVDAEEFDKVAEIIMKGTSVAKRHTKKKQSNIARYFFGDDRSKQLTCTEFVLFQENIQRDILKMEFDKLNPDENNLITQKAFANMILLHANFDDEHNRRIRKRIRKHFKKESSEEIADDIPNQAPKMSFDEVYNFFEFMKNIHDVETAFAFYSMSGKEIDVETMQSIARTVCGINLSDEIVDLIFTVFDEDDSKTLSRREFVDVMKARLQRGLDSKRGIEFTARAWALTTCACEAYLPENVKKLFHSFEQSMSSK